MKKVMIALVLALVSVTMAFAASNHVQEGNAITLQFSTTSPSSGDPVAKYTAVASGGITGVALNGSGTASEKVTVSTEGVWKLPVQAITNPINIGDTVYATTSGIQYGVASLTNVSSGLPYGTALESLVVASNTQTIKVLLRHP